MVSKGSFHQSSRGVLSKWGDGEVEKARLAALAKSRVQRALQTITRQTVDIMDAWCLFAGFVGGRVMGRLKKIKKNKKTKKKKRKG